MLLLELIIGLALVIWFVLSILLQFRGRLSERLAAHDFLNLLPIWTFFAPAPGASDYHLLYRDFDSLGVASEWVQIPSTFQRSVIRTIWNPRKRINKGVLDMIQVLSKMQNAFINERAVVCLSIPYLALTNFVCGQPRSNGAVSREFVIVETHGYHARYPLKVVFRSDAHPFE